MKAASATAMILSDAKGALELVCTKCTRFEVFPAPDKHEAYKRAAKKGWQMRVDNEQKKIVATICPRCAR